jgi:hypothetical protein
MFKDLWNAGLYICFLYVALVMGNVLAHFVILLAS